ncbi:MAG: dynamin family protein [Dehalococcoidia bacterium]|nr:dynamin family protein [Dehalococcoidia bacterium]
MDDHKHEKTEGVLHMLLEEINSLLCAAGADLSAEQQRICEIQSRLSESRFHLAVLGQFKRGKSTFLNALLGEKLLPSAVVPLTSVPTFISWAPERTIRVAYSGGRTEIFAAADSEQASEILAGYVTEEKNPLNRLAVESVEVGHPSSLLHNGVVLIDTPGIGSTFAHNTEATLKFIPQCDAAFFLISADPPITQVETEFLKSVKARVVQLFFIMNKIDYLSNGEQTEAGAFLKRVLEEQAGVGEKISIFNISAKQGLEARAGNNVELWRNSGMETVEDHLVKFLVEKKSHVLNRALTRKTQDIVGDSLMQLQLQQRSLSLPLDDLEKRIEVFQTKLKEAEKKKITFKDLLAGDQKRTVELINEQSGELFRSYYKQLCDEVDRLLRESKDIGSVEKESSQYISEVVPSVFNRELEKTALQMDEHVNATLGSYQQQLIELVESVRKAAADIFEISYIRSCGEDILEMKHKPFWVTEGWRVNWSPLPENWTESLLPGKMRMRRLRKRLVEDIDAIISHNVGNLRWATVCNITDSFYAFGRELDRQIQRTIDSTEGAINAAHKKRIEKSDSIDPELNKIHTAVRDLQKIKSQLIEYEDSVSRLS